MSFERSLPLMRALVLISSSSEALTSEQLAQLNPLLTALLARFEEEFDPASRHDVTH
jgi:hypothetical protein